MSKIKTAVLEFLSDGRWHTTTEITDHVCKQLRTNRTNVQSVIHTLSGGHHIIKEHIEDSHNACRYKVAAASAGFGISQHMASFNHLLKVVRGGHAAR